MSGARWLIALSLGMGMACGGSPTEARLIGFGGGGLIDVSGNLGLGSTVVPFGRLSVGLFVLGVDLDLLYLGNAVEFVPALAARLPALFVKSVEFYLSVAPLLFQVAPTYQIHLRSAIRWGVGAGFGFVSIFGEMMILADWGPPLTWRGPGIGLGAQIGF